jgi:hypothetical protein
MSTLDLIDGLATVMHTVIIWTYVSRTILRSRCPRVVNTVFFEVRWAFPWVAAWIYILDPTLRGETFTAWDYFMILGSAYVWWAIWRDKDDDDRWKRRAKAAKEKIVRTAAGLSVVPAPGGAR